MSNTPRPAPAEQIESLTEEELTARLARVRAEVPLRLPIVDDDDLEQAIEEATDQVVDRRRSRP